MVIRETFVSNIVKAFVSTGLSLSLSLYFSLSLARLVIRRAVVRDIVPAFVSAGLLVADWQMLGPGHYRAVGRLWPDIPSPHLHQPATNKQTLLRGKEPAWELQAGTWDPIMAAKPIYPSATTCWASDLMQPHAFSSSFDDTEKVYNRPLLIPTRMTQTPRIGGQKTLKTKMLGLCKKYIFGVSSATKPAKGWFALLLAPPLVRGELWSLLIPRLRGLG